MGTVPEIFSFFWTDNNLPALANFLYLLTHSKIKFYIIWFFFSTIYIKIFLKGEFKQTNNNDLLEKDGGTKNCIYQD